MKVTAFNGSPRKKWNTAVLLGKALEGAASCGADTELIHLYDTNYKGCTSCFSCKVKGGMSYGRCGFRDDLTPVLEKARESDVLIFGSPVYFRSVSGEMRSFLERLIFQYYAYSNPPSSLFHRKISIGFIYTMNNSKTQMLENGIQANMETHEKILKLIFGAFESLYCCDTYQFNDYSRFVSDYFDPLEKKKKRETQFPKDCEDAFKFGIALVNNT